MFTVTGVGALGIRAACGPLAMLLAELPRPLLLDQQREPEPLNPGRPATGGRVWATAHEQRGSGGMICAPPAHGRTMFGTLVVVSAATDRFTPDCVRDATTVAIHASIALATVRNGNTFTSLWTPATSSAAKRGP